MTNKMKEETIMFLNKETKKTESFRLPADIIYKHWKRYWNISKNYTHISFTSKIQLIEIPKRRNEFLKKVFLDIMKMEVNDD